jgi:hypothetical protein
MWMGFGINAAPGLLLLTAYPTKSLTNPLFYVKLCLIGLAVITMQRIHSQVFGDISVNEASMIARGKLMAIWSLVFRPTPDRNISIFDLCRFLERQDVTDEPRFEFCIRLEVRRESYT